MGVLDDAIREHLDLKRRRGASEAEIAHAEAEALGPARRAAPPVDDDEIGDEPFDHVGETRVLDSADDEPARKEPTDDGPPDRGPPDDEPPDDKPVAEVAPPREKEPEPEPTRAVHDIDEDPLAPPPPVHRTPPEERPATDDEPAESSAVDEPAESPAEDEPAESSARDEPDERPPDDESDHPTPTGTSPPVDDPIKWPRGGRGTHDGY